MEEIINRLSVEHNIPNEEVKKAVEVVLNKVKDYENELSDFKKSKTNGSYVQGFNRGNQVGIYNDIVKYTTEIANGNEKYANALTDLFKTKAEQFMIPRDMG